MRIILRFPTLSGIALWVVAVVFATVYLWRSGREAKKGLQQ